MIETRDELERAIKNADDAQLLADYLADLFLEIAANFGRGLPIDRGDMDDVKTVDRIVATRIRQR